MTLNVVTNIVDQSHVMSSMEGEGPVEALVRAKSLAVRLMYCTNHMEMNGVSTDLEGLSNVSELDVLQSRYKGIVSFRVQEDSGSIFIL